VQLERRVARELGHSAGVTRSDPTAEGNRRASVAPDIGPVTSALLGVATAVVNGLLAALAHALAAAAPTWGWPAWQLGLVAFVVGWVFQFVGHVFERRKPAFADDVVGLLVGPMFVVAEWLIALGLLRGLHERVLAEAGPTR